MKKLGFAALAAVATLALAAPAQAGVLDHFQVKVGVSGVLPDETGSPIPVDISSEYVPSLQASISSTITFRRSCSAASPRMM